MRQRQHGMTLIELTIACLIMLLVMGGAISLFATTYQTHDFVLTQNFANSSGRTVIDTLADHLRNAALNGPVVFSAVASSDITYYVPGGGTVRYYRYVGGASPTLRRVDSGGTTDVLTGLTSLIFTYYVPTAGNYNAPAASGNDWATTVNANAPTSEERLTIGAVLITATVTANGRTRTLTSFVRLRNSPVKSGV